MNTQGARKLTKIEKIYTIHEENGIRIEPGKVVNDYTGNWFKISNSSNNNYRYTHFRIIDNCTVEGYVCKPILYGGEDKPAGFNYVKLDDPFKYFNKSVVERIYNREQAKNNNKHRIFLTHEAIQYYKLVCKRNKLNKEKKHLASEFNEQVKLWLLSNNDDNIFEKVCEYDDQIMKYNINIQETTNKINSLVNRFKSLQEMYK